MEHKQVIAVAKVFARYELFDWETLPEVDPNGLRDREAFKLIAKAALEAAAAAE